jgi:hypothetical protein
LQGTGDGQFAKDEEDGVGPGDVAVDLHGGVFVADTYNHRIQKFDSSGKFVCKWGCYGRAPGQFTYPQGIAVDPHGYIFVVDGCRVQKFRPTFATREITGAHDQPIIEWHSTSGGNYLVWASGDLLDWECVTGPLPGSDTGVNFWTDDGRHGLGPPSEALCRFYRVELLPLD